MSRVAVVLGASGQVGAAVVQQLIRADWRVLAISRHVPPGERDGVRWLRGEFDAMPDLPARVDCIFSTGPLLRFARWFAQSSIVCPRIVAFSSTSVLTKHDSIDEDERALMASLRQGEAEMAAAAAQRGAQLTVLRPTLIYGAGRDQSLSRIAGIARRSGFFVLPAHANGRRQPVHVQDLAAAAVAVVDATPTHGQTYALPGGETLSYHAMVARWLRAMQPAPRLITLPSWLFGALVRAAHAVGRLRAMNAAMLARMQADLVFDAEPARRDFGYAPRAFVPDAAALPATDQ